MSCEVAKSQMLSAQIRWLYHLEPTVMPKPAVAQHGMIIAIIKLRALFHLKHASGLPCFSHLLSLQESPLRPPKVGTRFRLRDSSIRAAMRP